MENVKIGLCIHIRIRLGWVEKRDGYWKELKKLEEDRKIVNKTVYRAYKPWVSKYVKLYDYKAKELITDFSDRESLLEVIKEDYLADAHLVEIHTVEITEKVIKIEKAA